MLAPKSEVGLALSRKVQSKLRPYARFVGLASVIVLVAACQTAAQKTNNDALINEALSKAAIPVSRGAIVAVASRKSGLIVAEPVYHGVTLSRHVTKMLDRKWVGQPISNFENEARGFLTGPVQEFGYPDADRNVLVFSN